jgi:hypothetical protein
VEREHEVGGSAHHGVGLDGDRVANLVPVVAVVVRQ